MQTVWTAMVPSPAGGWAALPQAGYYAPLVVPAAGWLARTGVPTDAAVQMAGELAVPGLMGPAPRNPLYEGLPWFVPGPVSGAPYYDR